MRRTGPVKPLRGRFLAELTTPEVEAYFKRGGKTALMPQKTPGSGADPRGLVNAKTSDGLESLAGVRHLLISREEA
jgi:hypothetical protein